MDDMPIKKKCRYDNLRIKFEKRIAITINKYNYLSLDGIIHSQYHYPFKFNNLKLKKINRIIDNMHYMSRQS